MKTVVHLVPSWPSEYRKYDCIFLYEQIKNLALKSDYQYIVIVGYPIGWYIKNKTLWFLDKPITIDLSNVRVVHFFYPNIAKYYQRFSKIAYFYIRKRVKSLLKTSDLIIHAHFLTMGDYAYKLYKEFDVDYILTEHSGKLSNYFDVYKFSTSYFKLIIEKAQVVICVSNHTKEQLFLITKKENNKIKIIPNAVDEENFSCTKRINHNDTFNILYVGNIIETKGIKVLHESFLLINRKYDNYTLTLVGTGNLVSYCNEFIAKHNLKNKIKLIGAINNDALPNIINQHHILILPSYSESFGIVVIEALACGIPVIVTACGGPEMIVDKPFLGEVIPIGNITALANSIEKIRMNYDQYDPEKIRQNIIDRFSWNKVAHQIIASYNL